MRPISRHVTSLGYWLALVVLAADALLVAWNLTTILDGNAKINRGRMVLYELEQVLSLLKDAETGQRGYLLVGREEYLAPYRDAETSLTPALRSLRTIGAEDDLGGRVDELSRIAADKMAELDQTIQLKKQGRVPEALEIVRTDLGKRLMDQFRSVVVEVRAVEERRLDARQAESRSAVRQVIGTFAATTFLALILLAGVAMSSRREARARERAAELVRANEAWLRTTVASIGDAVIATDERGVVKFLNPVASALTGWPASEAVGRPIGEVFVIIHEQTREPAEIPVDRVIQDGVVLGLADHTVLIARDGSESPIEDSAGPIKNGQGTVIGVVMVFQDASERRKRENDLRDGERQFRTLAESIPQLAWMARPDGHIYWYNKRWYDFTGTTPADMEGWGWQKVHDPNALPGVLVEWRRSITSGEPFDMVFPLLGADGHFRSFLTRVMPFKGEDGQVAHWFGTNTDISERLRIEAELKLAKEEAEQASAAKSRFLAVLSHELRTPLNPILLAVSSMLERPASPEDVRANLEMIRQNVNLQSRLIDDLLDVMRIVREKMPLHWEVTDVHVLLNHSIGICRSEVFGKGLKISLDLEAECHHLNADPVRLQQVFWNLIKNAVKFSTNGGKITIRTFNEAEADGKDRLVIEFADTGIGIDAEYLDTIFDPFQQGETSITRRFGGLGLGLAISKGIVEGHGGLLTVRSPGPGHGTTFRLELQAMTDPKTAEDGLPDSHATSNPIELAPTPLQILLVEDEPATCRLLARLLRGLGHNVTTAGTIAEAIEREQSADFGLIVSDIGLPDGSGLELIRRVVARRGQVRAIALTGYGMEDDIQRSREAGFTSHMTKPIDFTKLEAMIRQVAT